MFDTIASTRTALEKLAASFEPRTLTHDQAVRLVDDLGVIHRLAEGVLGQAVKRATETAGCGKGAERDAAQLYARAVGVEMSEARRAMATARCLERLPETEAAVRDGRLSTRQAQFVTAAAQHDPAAEAELLAAAEQGMVPLKDACLAVHARVEDPVERAVRQHSTRRFRMWTAGDGMVEGHFRLTPEVGGRVKAAIDADVQRIFRSRRKNGPHESHEAYAADALAERLDGSGGSKAAVGTTVHVVIDHGALVRGNAAKGERCEIPGVGPVNAEWVRNLLGEAFVTALVKKGRDITTVAHFGRHIPAHLRTAMIVGGRECDTDGCHNRGYLEIDHSETDFAHGGPASWQNLRWKCSICHHRKTQGWKPGPRNPVTGKRTLVPP